MGLLCSYRFNLAYVWLCGLEQVLGMTPDLPSVQPAQLK